MTCQEVKTEKYQTRKSPPFHAKDCKDLTKKGKDGDYISKPDTKGIYKWVKSSANITRKAKKPGKSYLIHNNGSRPYKVEVSGNTVQIYKGEYKKLADGKTIDYDHMDYNKLLKTLTVKQVHVGKYEGAFGLGNSLLLDLGGKKYLHIGFNIYEFTMEDDFEAYYSLIGNSDVPYPVLLGSKYVYFMLDYKYLPREIFKTKMTAKDWEDAYQYYYGYIDYETGEQGDRNKKDKVHKINKANEKKFKNFKILFN